MVKSAVALGAFAGGALAASSAYGQCGGQGWSGDTSCVSGYTCKYVNDWYSQCLPGSGGGDTGSGGDDGGSDDGGDSGGDGSEDQGDGFEWFGINESVAEFGTAFPGTLNKDYRFPDTEAIGTLISEGYNTFRVAFAMERMAQGSITAEFDADYLQGIKDVVNYVTSNGAYAVLDPHNYGRYNGAIITDVSSFGSFWTKLATEFADNSRVIFDTNNEYNSMDQGLVFDLNQAAIDAIRGAGATSQTIFVEGNSWSGAWTWTDVNDNLKDLSDPQDNMVYEMHQYLDSDGSGTHEECVSATIGSERVADATQWLRDNGKRGIIGETAGGPNSQCKQAITDLVDYLEGNSDVWTGMLWWAAGPWWADYMYSFEPPSGTAYQYYDSLLKQHTV